MSDFAILVQQVTGLIQLACSRFRRPASDAFSSRYLNVFFSAGREPGMQKNRNRHDEHRREQRDVVAGDPPGSRSRARTGCYFFEVHSQPLSPWERAGVRVLWGTYIYFGTGRGAGAVRGSCVETRPLAPVAATF